MSHKDIIDYDAAKATAASDDKAEANKNGEIIGVLQQVKQRAERGAKFARTGRVSDETADQLTTLGFTLANLGATTEVRWP